SALKRVRADSIRALRCRGKQRRTFGDVTPEGLSAVRPQLDAPRSRHGNRPTVTAIDDQEIVGQYSTARLQERREERRFSVAAIAEKPGGGIADQDHRGMPAGDPLPSQ